MDAAKIVVHEPDRHGSRVILNLLRKRIREPREAANAHPYRKILTFHVTCADVFGVGIATHNFHVALPMQRAGE